MTQCYANDLTFDEWKASSSAEVRGGGGERKNAVECQGGQKAKDQKSGAELQSKIEALNIYHKSNLIYVSFCSSNF